MTTTGMTTGGIRVAVLGASGYSGGELLRLIAGHDGYELSILTGERNAGQPLATVFPNLASLAVPDLIKIADADWDQVDAVFCCLPHGTTQDVISTLPDHLRIVDLSADFRLSDPEVYATWYGHEHRAVHLQASAVYGLTEFARAEVGAARLVASPGCYPTGAQLPLVPLISAGAISADDIIVDAKSGVSGAGREAKQATLYAEVGEGVHAYGIGAHRHAPEIEQGLSTAAGRPVLVNFTPHLIPMNRGILSTIYAKLADGVDVDGAREILTERYADEPFVNVLPAGKAPSTRHVRASNNCLIGVFADRLPGRVILVSAIDNLVKGASGQAIQNMNVMCSLPETQGLEQVAMFP